MISLSRTDLARVKTLTDRCYPLLSPLLRTIFNEQLLESRNHYEVEDWLERVELTAQFYLGEGLSMKVARPRTSRAKPKA